MPARPSLAWRKNAQPGSAWSGVIVFMITRSIWSIVSPASATAAAAGQRRQVGGGHVGLGVPAAAHARPLDDELVAGLHHLHHVEVRDHLRRQVVAGAEDAGAVMGISCVNGSGARVQGSGFRVQQTYRSSERVSPESDPEPCLTLTLLRAAATASPTAAVLLEEIQRQQLRLGDGSRRRVARRSGGRPCRRWASATIRSWYCSRGGDRAGEIGLHVVGPADRRVVAQAEHLGIQAGQPPHRAPGRRRSRRSSWATSSRAPACSSRVASEMISTRGRRLVEAQAAIAVAGRFEHLERKCRRPRSRRLP